MSQWNPVHSLAHFKKGRKDINDECTNEGRKQERRGKGE
jgi:hypothetical protein